MNMPYSTLLTQCIEQSGLSIKEIAKKCKEYGADITASYISMLKNSDNEKWPSDEVSRALAKACGKDEQLLVIEAYVDKAPPETQAFFKKVKESVLQTALYMFKNQVTDDQFKELATQMNSLPMAQIILEYSKTEPLTFSKEDGAGNAKLELTEEQTKLLMEVKEQAGFKVPDDSMFPTLPKGSTVTLEIVDIGQLKDGDIIGVNVDGKKDIIFRNCFFDKARKSVSLFPMNHSYPTETLNIKDIKIIGKVKRIITNLE